MPKNQSAKVQQLTIPQTALSPGNIGPFTTGLLPAGFAGYEIDFNIDPTTWPTAGNVLVLSAIGLNSDGTQAWPAADSITLAGPSPPAYDPAVQYSRRNIVTFNSAWFLCIQSPPNPGIDPTDTAYWQSYTGGSWMVTFPAGSPQVKLQLTGTVLQACKIGAVISSL